MQLSSTSSDILRHAETFAAKFVEAQAPSHSPNPDPSAAVVVHHHHHHGGGGWIFWDRREPCYDHCLPKTDAQQKKDQAALAVFVASVIFLATSYFLGQEFANESELKSRTQILRDQREELKQCPVEEQQAVGAVLDIEENMLDQMQAHARVGIVAKGALAGSTLAWGGGIGLAAFAGISGAAALMVPGLAVSALSAGALLYRWGYTDADTSLREQAIRLLDTATAIRV
jgi:hypothetical protein